jgi:hypothetical protein
MESPKSIILPDAEILTQRLAFLSLVSITEMREIPFIPFPDDKHTKAVEFAMIVRNEFIKRLRLELATVSTNTHSAFVRGRLYLVLDALRTEIVLIAECEGGWLQGQLEHTFNGIYEPDGVYDWAGKYLDSMLISIGV